GDPRVKLAGVADCGLGAGGTSGASILVPLLTLALLESSTGVPLLLNQAFVLTLCTLSVNVGNWENRNSPFVCTGPLKLDVWENQTAPPVGEVWVSVQSAYMA